MKATISGINEEGAVVTFDEPVAVNGGLATTEWWLSWDKIASLVVRALLREDILRAEVAASAR